MSWLNELVSQHEELESPPNFWYWAGLCTISAVVKDKVWLARGGAFWNTYPNIYVMLYAGSGLKKGPPVALARKLVHKVNNTKIISGRASIQGVLKELSTATTTPGGKIETNSTCFYCASEFSSSLVADPSAMVILTDLYDRSYNEGKYESLLKMEKFKLNNPCISLLVATNQAHFEDFVAPKDVKGGFIGRTFVIAEDKVYRRNPLIRPMQVVPDIEGMADYLKEVAKLEGPFLQFHDTPAGDLYEEWYDTFYEEIDKSTEEDITGTVQRIGDAVLKVAMLLALSEKPELTLSKANVEEAIGVCEKLLGHVRKSTYGTGMSATAHQKKLVIMTLLEREDHQITRQEFLNLNWKHFDDGDQLADCTGTLMEAGMIQIETLGNQVYYSMSEKAVKEMKYFLKLEEEQ